MLALASSWFNLNLFSPELLIKKLFEVGAESIELQYRMPRDYWLKLKPLLKKEGVKVSSIHNFFPIPEGFKRGSGDAFLLTSLDDEELKLAVKYTANTIRIASEVEAPAVVLHTGSVPVAQGLLDEFYQLFDEGEREKSQQLLKELMEERGRKQRKYLDRLLTSLDRLAPVAEKEGVKLGIENRYHPNEIPLSGEMALILKEFEGAPIYYWHDVGHAHHLEFIGVLARQEWLEKFSSHLIGVHLHDVRGREDHFAPGSGEFDFLSLLQYIPEEAIKVVEVHPKVKEEEVKKGFEFLREVGFK